MEDLTDILASIKQKVTILVGREYDMKRILAEREAEIKRLNAQIETLKLQQTRIEQENKELKERINNKTNLINNSEVSEYIDIINDLIEKIDKSIAVISSM
ncbi:MAG: hypothetical protein HUK18_05205 [Bacteroidales bacterium]|nr:hypothetical protein [Bacteroidales bacterium]